MSDNEKTVLVAILRDNDSPGKRTIAYTRNFTVGEAEGEKVLNLDSQPEASVIEVRGNKDNGNWIQHRADHLDNLVVEDAGRFVYENGIRPEILEAWRHGAASGHAGDIPENTKFSDLLYLPYDMVWSAPKTLPGTGGVGAKKTLPTFKTSTGQLVADRYMPYRNDEQLFSTWIKECMDDGDHVFLYGPPGTGKTYLSRAIFEGRFYYALGNDQTTYDDLVMSYVEDPSAPLGARAVPGPLYKAHLDDNPEGVVVFVDEVGIIPPKVMAAVYATTEGQPLEIPSRPDLGEIYPKTKVSFIFATNPEAEGAIVDDPLLSRASEKFEFLSDWDATLHVLGGDPRAVEYARAMNKLWLDGLVSNAPQTREVLKFNRSLRRSGLEHAVRALVTNSKAHDREEAVKAVQQVWGLTLDPDTAHLRIGG